MAKLKKVLDWFVTIDYDEEEGHGEDEEYEDEEYEDEEGQEDGDGESLDALLAAQEADRAAASRPSRSSMRARRPSRSGMAARGGAAPRRVLDMGINPYAGELDEGALSDLDDESHALHGFEDIYMAAGLPGEGESGFTIFKVEQMLSSGHLMELSKRNKAASVLMALEATGGSLQAVVEDAIARDKALDQYESIKRREIKDLEDEVEYNNALIQAEIEAFLAEKQEQIRANKEKLDVARESFNDWVAAKGAEEERLFETVSIFVDENPITRG